MSRVAVLDFETTGLSPERGDRATEIAIVMVEGGRVVDRFASLMNAGVFIPPYITELTGITNSMVQAAPRASVVMAEAARFVGDTLVVAHNASFDQRFWRAELGRLRVAAPQAFVCTLLLSRRLFPDAPNHKLGTLVERFALPRPGASHRALADAEMAASLWNKLHEELRGTHAVPRPDEVLLMRLQRCPRAGIPALLAKYRAELEAPPDRTRPEVSRAGAWRPRPDLAGTGARAEVSRPRPDLVGNGAARGEPPRAELARAEVPRAARVEVVRPDPEPRPRRPRQREPEGLSLFSGLQPMW